MHNKTPHITQAIPLTLAEHEAVIRHRTRKELGILGALLLTATLALVLCAGCLSSFHPGARTPDVRHLDVAESPDVAYGKAVRTMLTLGEVTQQNPQLRVVQAKVHGAVLMTASVTAADAGSRVEVQARLMQGKVVFGSLTETAQFLDAYTKQPH